MRALVVNREQAGGLRLEERPDPVPTPEEALVRIMATTLNFGEVVNGGGWACVRSVPIFWRLYRTGRTWVWRRRCRSRPGRRYARCVDLVSCSAVGS